MHTAMFWLSLHTPTMRYSVHLAQLRGMYAEVIKLPSRL